MGVFCDRLKFGSTAALDCPIGKNKGRYCKKELLLLLVLLVKLMTDAKSLHSNIYTVGIGIFVPQNSGGVLRVQCNRVQKRMKGQIVASCNN